MAGESTVACPKCKFRNRAGDARCLVCKTDLTGAAAPSDAAKPATAAPKPATPASAPPKPAATKPAPAAKPATPAAKPPVAGRPTVSAPRPVASAAGRATAPAPAKPSPRQEPVPRPETRRHTRPGVPVEAVEALAWIHCQPLPPIPLQPSHMVTVGRHESCDLVLPHKEVSRHHATFKIMGKVITLEDQGSSNGSYLNGKRVGSQNVKVGDLVTIGPYDLEICATAEPPQDMGADTKQMESTRVGLGSTGSAAFAGKIEDVPLIEVLQQIEFNKKTGTLQVADGLKRGTIVFGEGRPLAASWHDAKDVDAVRAMLRVKQGRFVFSGSVEATEATIRVTVTAILLDHSRETDELTKEAVPQRNAAKVADAPAAAAAEGGADATATEEQAVIRAAPLPGEGTYRSDERADEPPPADEVPADTPTPSPDDATQDFPRSGPEDETQS